MTLNFVVRFPIETFPAVRGSGGHPKYTSTRRTRKLTTLLPASLIDIVGDASLVDECPVHPSNFQQTGDDAEEEVGGSFKPTNTDQRAILCKVVEIRCDQDAGNKRRRQPAKFEKSCQRHVRSKLPRMNEIVPVAQDPKPEMLSEAGEIMGHPLRGVQLNTASFADQPVAEMDAPARPFEAFIEVFGLDHRGAERDVIGIKSPRPVARMDQRRMKIIERKEPVKERIVRHHGDPNRYVRPPVDRLDNARNPVAGIETVGIGKSDDLSRRFSYADVLDTEITFIGTGNDLDAGILFLDGRSLVVAPAVFAHEVLDVPGGIVLVPERLERVENRNI